METGRKSWASAASLPMLSITIACLSMGSSFFQSWNYSRNIDSVQRNVLRAENLRTCREIIDVFFQLRLKAEEANARTAAAPSALEMKALAYRFGALGTFLANFRDEEVRTRYTQLSWDLLKLASDAPSMPKPEFDALYGRVDKVFSDMNQDCVTSAQGRLL